MRSGNRTAPVTVRRPRGTSLRAAWSRSFAVLLALVLLGGIASIAGTRALVGTFRNTAERVENEATLLAQLRADVATHTGLLHSLAEQAKVEGPLATAEAAVRAGFERGIGQSDADAGRPLLQQGFDRWLAIVATAAPISPSAPVATIRLGHQALADATEEVAQLLDGAGAAGRADARANLARDSRGEKKGLAALAALVLMMVASILRLARQLSTQVIRPVGRLRDSANQLAAGQLDHHVEIDRNDELGDLAVSFNAMADAIAGSQRTLTLQANHDSLTGLANRAAFQARLQTALAHPDRRSGTQAVLFVDLDDFKDVNDTLGHAAGDELLCVVAARLRDAVRPGDLVARLGGDEFALFLDGVADASVAFAVAERAVAALASPVEIDHVWAHVGASVGLAMRHDGSDPDSLMREADVAMYAAKGRGKNRVERYDATLNDAAVAHHTLKAEVGGAAGRGELLLDYQPIVDLADGTFVGVEALVRWQHPSRGLLRPSAFIDLAEETGAIVGIGSWVLETAAGQLQHWQSRYGLPELKLSVNVSVCQLDDPGYADHVRDVLRRTGLDPHNLIVEVTESVLADPAGGAAGSLETLRRHGVRVALDDFGTGYSTIEYLRQLPVDILKIDRSFISGEHANRPGDLLLEAIVGLAQRLALDVIAEGIEEPDQLTRLQRMGCRTGQGFLMSRPVPVEAIDLLLSSPASLLPFPPVEDGWMVDLAAR